MLLGREIGLSEAALADLGVAATFHDAGYTADEDGYPPPFERHTTAGARQLLKQRGFHEARIRRLLVCLEHHRRFDNPRPASLSARILHIAHATRAVLPALRPRAVTSGVGLEPALSANHAAGVKTLDGARATADAGRQRATRTPPDPRQRTRSTGCATHPVTRTGAAVWAVPSRPRRRRPERVRGSPAGPPSEPVRAP